MAAKPLIAAGPSGSPSLLRAACFGFLRLYVVAGDLIGASKGVALSMFLKTKKSPHKRAPSSWFVHLHAVVTSLQKVFSKGAPLCRDAGGILPTEPTVYKTKKSSHKRALSPWFWHLHAVGCSLQEVFRESAPLCGDAGGIVPVGSKGAALGMDAGCALRLLPSLAPRAMPPAMPPAPVLGRGRAVVPQGPVPTVGQAQGWPRGQTARQPPGVIRVLESRYFGSVRCPLVLLRCFRRKRAAKWVQTCTA